jgi:diguanylate cyclase (GGDEF)-like protein
LPTPADLQAPSITLHYLLRALALADGIARFTAPGELLDAAAREHARLGDYRQAYEFSQRASVSRETSRSQEARNRAVAMEVTHETERARADAEHQRSLARAQAERLEMLERLAGSDTLTGLSNRLRLDQVLDEQAARLARSGTPVSVILLDLDHFKTVNDQHGHPVGDRVLVATGALLTASSRQTDEVGRWGGEEFLLVCGDTDLQGARALAQKLRQRIAAHDFGVVGRRTASFGVAQLAAGEDVASLVARADVALYRAKAAGRDRVETA